jgi:DNA-binding XRE family transcriptional regulator
VVADLERRLEEAEDENDALTLRLAKIEDALFGGEHVPAGVVVRLADGASPVRVWREPRGLALRALAEKAGISAAMLSEIENGKKEGSVRTLAALACACVFRAKSATDSGMKSATDSDLISAIRI